MEESRSDENVLQEVQELLLAKPVEISVDPREEEDMIVEVINPDDEKENASTGGNEDTVDSTSVSNPQDDIEMKEEDPKPIIVEPVTVDDDEVTVMRSRPVTRSTPIETDVADVRTMGLASNEGKQDKDSEVTTKEDKSKETDDKSTNVPPDVKLGEVKTMDAKLKDEKEGRRKRKIVTPQQNTPSPVNEVAIEENGTAIKRKRTEPRHDEYCWRCHKETVEIQCNACPRSWHRRCMGGAPPLTVKQWICSECATILQAENAETRSESMAQLSMDQLCMLLKHVVERMRDQTGSEPFWKPVNTNIVTNYMNYIIKPMDLSLLENNVKSKLYGSTDAFMADAKWIQHNCVVFNTCGGVYTDTSKLTNTAKQMLKTARQEVSEIEACPDCYAHGRNLPRPQPLWFIEPCRRPHPIVWAKLKGFPFWPAKAMPRLNTQGLVDVRFFGQHDRAWVSPKDIFLFSEEPPAPLPRKKKTEMEECVQEVKCYCEKLEQVFGKYTLPDPKIQYDPHDPLQIKLLLPSYDPTKSIQNIHLKSEPSKDKEKKPVVKRNSIVPKKSVDIPSVKSETDIKTSNVKSLVNNEIVSTKPDQKILRKKKPVVTPRPKPKELNNSLNANATNKVQSPAPANRIVIPVSKITMKNVVNAKRMKAANSKPTIPILPLKAGSLSALENSKSIIVKPKPKTKMVQPVNMEKKVINNTNQGNTSDKGKVMNKVDLKLLNNKEEVPKRRVVTPLVNSSPKVAPTKEQRPKAVYVVVNTSSVDTVRRNMINSESNRIHDNITLIKQEPKEEQQPTWKKESKARKSFRNKPPSFPQKITSNNRISTNLSDAMVYIPPRPNNNNINRSISNNSQSSTYELPPPEAGPVIARLHRGSKELAARMAQILEETIKDVAESNDDSNLSDTHAATIHFLKLKIERMKWQHQQQIQEIKHNNECVLRELRASTEVERYRAIQEVRREADIDKFRSIEETKRKQWCAMCGREAMFYCCWNTAYCDYPCQQKHWSTHMSSCAQKSSPRVADALVTSSTVKTQQQQGMPKLVINTNRSMPNQWRS